MFAGFMTTSDNGGVEDTVNTIAQNHDQIILSLIALSATLVTGLIYLVKNYRTTKDTNLQTTAVNAAVNNVGEGEHRLYDKITAIHQIVIMNKDHLDDLKIDVDELVVQQKAFSEKGWQHLPPDLRDAPALTQTIRDIQNKNSERRREHEHIQVQLNNILIELREHVKWEMNEKYPRPKEE